MRSPPGRRGLVGARGLVDNLCSGVPEFAHMKQIKKNDCYTYENVLRLRPITIWHQPRNVFLLTLVLVSLYTYINIYIGIHV